MKKLARAFALLFLVLTFLLSIGFSFFNTQKISLSFGFLVLEPQPLSVWVLSAFVLGGVAGLALGAGFFRQWRSVRENHRLHAEVKRLELALEVKAAPSRQV